jgi:hypothetical protein
LTVSQKLMTPPKKTGDFFWGEGQWEKDKHFRQRKIKICFYMYANCAKKNVLKNSLRKKL